MTLTVHARSISDLFSETWNTIGLRFVLIESVTHMFCLSCIQKSARFLKILTGFPHFLAVVSTHWCFYFYLFHFPFCDFVGQVVRVWFAKSIVISFPKCVPAKSFYYLPWHPSLGPFSFSLPLSLSLFSLTLAIYVLTLSIFWYFRFSFSFINIPLISFLKTHPIKAIASRKCWYTNKLSCTFNSVTRVQSRSLKRGGKRTALLRYSSAQCKQLGQIPGCKLLLSDIPLTGE